MGKTSIEWADSVWNPFVGCTRVSAGCQKCYAERFTARFAGIPGHKFEGVSKNTPQGPRWTGKVSLAEKDIDQPLHWKKPRRIFVNSISDTFHDMVPLEWLDRIFAIMAKAPQHTFLVLTKRPHYMRDYMRSRYHFPQTAPQIKPPKNIWLGTSVENQAAADERIPFLLSTQAAVRWISAEPLLGPINLEHYLCGKGFPVTDDLHDAPDGAKIGCYERVGMCWEPRLPGLQLCVVGGESGPGARPCDIGWIRSVRDQCKAAGVACFVKQLGKNCVTTPSQVNGFRNRWKFKAPKGGDISEFPEDLRVREIPQ